MFVLLNFLVEKGGIFMCVFGDVWKFLWFRGMGYGSRCLWDIWDGFFYRLDWRGRIDNFTSFLICG